MNSQFQELDATASVASVNLSGDSDAAGASETAADASAAASSAAFKLMSALRRIQHIKFMHPKNKSFSVNCTFPIVLSRADLFAWSHTPS